MEARFIAQPYDNRQLGDLFLKTLSAEGNISNVTIVSAFVSRVTAMRLKERLRDLAANGSSVKLVIGVDMGGTSKETLQELASWPVDIFVFKNRRPGITFHPKIYRVERANKAEIFLGSNNLTDGGLFTNYEGAVHITYDLPADREQYDAASTELAGFLAPSAQVTRKLDTPYLQILVNRDDIPTEAEARKRQRSARIGNQGSSAEAFGTESTPGRPPLPVIYQDVVLAANTNHLDEIRKERRKKRDAKDASEKASLLSIPPVAELVLPTSFYMELNATKGKSAEAGGPRKIPGEQRIPLEAVWSAQEFWGWPDKYERTVNPRVETH